jgi:rhodanese-related sulfurtransferase
VTRRQAWRPAVLALLVTAPLLAQDRGAREPDDAGAPSIRIAWAEFKPLYDNGRLLVVDVRDEDAFAAGHIPGARSVPADRVDAAAPELARLGAPVVTYCACPSEHSSAEAALALRRHGVDARALIGGWLTWFEQTGGRSERGRPPVRR